MTPERGRFVKGRWVKEVHITINGERVVVFDVVAEFSGDFEHADTAVQVGHYEKGRFVGGCFERKGDRLVCTNPGAVTIRLPLKS